MWRSGFGDAASEDVGTLPFASVYPISPYGGLSINDVMAMGAPPAAADSAGGLADMITEANRRTAALQDVDLGTALQSKLVGVFGQGAALPVAIIGLGLVALALIPASGGRRR